MEDNERSPFTRVLYKGKEEVVLKIVIEGLKPYKNLIDTHEVHDGEANVTFNNKGYGMDAKIVVNKSQSKGTEMQVWRKIVRKFPSRIDQNKSFWRVEKDMVVITLVKRLEPGDVDFVNWEPLVYENTLDQYREEEDPAEETMTFDPSTDVFPMTSITVVTVDSRNPLTFVSRQPP